MTISTTTLLNSFSGNGSVVDFTYTYPINSASELLVIIKTDATGVETTKTLTSDYTVALAGDSGGTVTMGTAPASGETLFLIRNTTKTQGTDLIENDPFSAEGLEDSFDNLQMQIQEVSNEVDRSFKVSKTNSITTSEITTSAADRANKILSFDASGNLEATAFTNLDTLDEMTDVTITSVADNEVLAYDSSSSKWINQTPAEASLVSLTGSETLTNKTLTSPVINTSVSGTAVLDEDDMSSDSATKLATQQSIKAYVDSKKADMQFVLEDGDGTEVQIVKDSEVKFVEGGGIDINWTDTSTGSDADPFDLTFAIDSTVTTLTGSQTLTNKTLTSPVLNTGVSGTAVKDEDNMASDSATHLATQQSIKAYVDAVTTSLNAQDLDVSDGSSAIAIDLDSETLGILGGTGLSSSASGNNVTLSVDAAQTGITSVTNASLVLGRDADNDIDFTTDNQITFRVSANDGVVFKASGEIEAASLDISGDADIDGTLEADAITVNGTALNTVIAGVTVTNATNAVNSTHVSVADNESTNEENLIPFIEDASATGNVGLESDGDFAYNPSTGTVSATIFKGNIDAVDGDFDGTLEADSITVGGTNLTAIYSPIAGSSNIVTTGALNSGSITSGFGNIDNGSSTITTTGAVSTGALSVTGASTITSSSAGDLLTLKSTDAGAEAGPNLVLFRDSASPANDDVIGRIRFEGDDNEGNKTVYAQLTSQIIDKGSSGGEDSTFQMEVFNNGALRDILTVKGATGGTPEIVFNESSQNVDFRVESDGNTHMLFVDGGNNRVGIGTTPDLGAGLHIRTADSGATNVSNADDLVIEGSGVAGISIFTGTSSAGQINFGDSGANERGKLLYDHNGDYMAIHANSGEKMRIDSSGNVLAGKTSSGLANAGVELASDKLSATVNNATVAYLNRLTGDGIIVSFYQNTTEEGGIEVSGNTVNYSGFTGTHWSRLADNSKPTILRGTIMDSIDEMCDWYQAVADVAESTDDEGNVTPAHTVKEPIALGDKSVGDAITFTSDGTEYTGTIVKEDDVKHTKCKVSDTADSKKVYGVFSNWDDADDGLDGDVNDMNIAQVGTYIIRVNADEVVEAGDLLVSNGDGTAKKQDDDIIRSKTVAKVNSTVKIETYSDGSYTVPCTLHC